jgi:tetratricopeptide (TPR) repeat protein
MTMPNNGETLSSRYQIVRRLKEGGMGAIYEALDTRLNARVALKENSFTEDHLKASFRREAQLLANLSHPTLPRVTDYFLEADHQYLVMEFIDGDDLASTISLHRQPAPCAIVLDWAKQLLNVLDYLHNQPTPILHRDIKPSNLKVRDGRIFLLDFGLAYGHSGEMSTVVSGQFSWQGSSPRYSPPEQLNSLPTTPASDLYSLAATLYELLTARAPEPSESRVKSLQSGGGDTLKDIRVYRPELDECVARSIMKALALDITQRPQGAVEMFRIMFPERPAKARSRSVAAVAVGAVLMIAVLGVVMAFGVSHVGSDRCERASPLLGRILRCGNTSENAGPTPTTATSGNPLALQWTAEGEKLEQSAKYDEAIKKAREVLEFAPNYVYALMIYGDSLWDTRYELAESAAEMPGVQAQASKILELVPSPHGWEEYLARAWANLAKGNGELAIADATRTLELKADCVSALMIRATARSSVETDDNKGRLASLADYDEVIRLMPDYSQAYANRGSTYTQLGQYKLALSDYTEAIRLMPRAGFYVGRGDAYFGLQEHANARRDYLQAIDVSPKSYRAHLALADLFFEQDDWNDAVKSYSDAIGIHETAYALKKRGFAYVQARQFVKAVQDLTNVIRLEKSDYSTYYARAFAYLQMMQWERVIADCTKAIELAPESDQKILRDIYRGRAEAYRQVGEFRLARSDEESAADLAS